MEGDRGLKLNGDRADWGNQELQNPGFRTKNGGRAGVQPSDSTQA